MPEIRMKVSSTSVEDLEKAIEILRNEAEILRNLKISVVPLPTDILVLPTRKSPVGNGTATREHRELRIHKRLVIVRGELNTLSMFARRAFRHRRPSNVNLRASLKQRGF